VARAARTLRTGDDARNLVGARVKERRLALNLLQDELVARIARLTDGLWVMTFSELSSIEVGRRGCTDLECLTMSVALDVDLNWLVTGTSEQVTEKTLRALLKRRNDAESVSKALPEIEETATIRRRASRRQY